jgi:hypothetical protein
MKKFIFGIILVLAAGWIVNLVMAGNNIKENDSAQAATAAEVGEFPKGTIVPVKATTTANVKPALEKESIPKDTTAPAAPKKSTPAPIVKTAVKKTTTNTTLSGMVWDASARQMISSMAQFDYSSKIRQAYINKVNAYAKRNGIKVITASVINNMRE